MQYAAGRRDEKGEEKMIRIRQILIILLTLCMTFTMMPLAGSGGGGAC